MKVQLWKSSSAFITFDLPSGKSQVPGVAIITLSASFLCQNTVRSFLYTSLGETPTESLTGLFAYVAIPQQQPRPFFQHM